jgi:hypothetical protein
MMASASIGAASVDGHAPGASVRRDVETTRVASRSVAPRRAGERQQRIAHVARLVRRGEALRERLGSSASGIADRSSSKNRTCSSSGHAAHDLPERVRPTSRSRSASRRRVSGRTLHRPPPLMRILRPPSARALHAASCARHRVAAKIVAIVAGRSRAHHHHAPRRAPLGRAHRSSTGRYARHGPTASR